MGKLFPKRLLARFVAEQPPMGYKETEAQLILRFITWAADQGYQLREVQ